MPSKLHLINTNSITVYMQYAVYIMKLDLFNFSIFKHKIF